MPFGCSHFHHKRQPASSSQTRVWIWESGRLSWKVSLVPASYHLHCVHRLLPTTTPKCLFCKSSEVFNNELKKARVTLSGGSDSKESACQCRRPEFSPQVRKIPWRRAWQPTPIFLPGELHGQRSLVVYSPWGCKESYIPERVTHSQRRQREGKIHSSHGLGQGGRGWVQHETQEDQEIQKGGDLIPGELGALGMGTEAVVRGSRQADNHLKPRVLSLLWPLQTQPPPKQLRKVCCIGSGLPQAPDAKDSKMIKSVKVSASERSPQRGDVALTCLEQHRKSCHNYFQLSSHFLGGLHRVISILTTTFSRSCEKQSKPQI